MQLISVFNIQPNPKPFLHVLYTLKNQQPIAGWKYLDLQHLILFPFCLFSVLSWIYLNHDKQNKTRWWFQTFFIFTPVWGRFPIWLVFFRWVETTNQKTNHVDHHNMLRIIFGGAESLNPVRVAHTIYWGLYEGNLIKNLLTFMIHCYNLGGGFKYFLFSTLPGEMIHFDEHIFQMGWNHQLAMFWQDPTYSVCIALSSLEKRHLPQTTHQLYLEDHSS